MDTSKEHIEAQLAAYIDGELSDAQRQEIERHLGSHPHHRVLIEELIRTRDFVKQLPRAKAPDELNDALCGQLERSALLDMSEGHDSVILRINRWPQFAAVAAVVLLALGLGIVVYYVLPPMGPTASHGPVALREGGSDRSAGADRQPGASAAVPADSAAGARDNQPRRELAKKKRLDKETEAIAEKEFSSKLMTPAPPALPERAPVPSVAEPLGKAPGATEEKKKTLGDVAQADGASPSLYLLVETPQTYQASRQVSQFLVSNGIVYMAADSLPQQHGAEPNGQARSLASMAMGGASGPAAIKQELADKEKDDSAAQVKLRSSSSGAGAVAAAPAELPQPSDARAKVEDSPSLTTATQTKPSPAATARKQSDELATGMSQQPRGGAAISDPAMPESRRSDEKSDAYKAQSATQHSESPPVIVARMNYRQAEQLSVMLSNQQGQRASLRRTAADQIGPALLQQPAQAQAADSADKPSATRRFAEGAAIENRSANAGEVQNMPRAASATSRSSTTEASSLRLVDGSKDAAGEQAVDVLILIQNMQSGEAAKANEQGAATTSPSAPLTQTRVAPPSSSPSAGKPATRGAP